VDEGEAELTMTDEDVDIPAANLSHVFERYRRGSDVDQYDRTVAGLWA